MHPLNTLIHGTTALLIASLVLVAPPAGADPLLTGEQVLEEGLPPAEVEHIQVRSSSSSRRRRAKAVRFNLSIGGGVNVGNQWMDYEVDSKYQVPKNGLVEDTEVRNFYMIAKPALDIQVGLEAAEERLVIGFHFGLTGMSQRSTATMTGEWENGNTTVLATSGETIYNPPMVLMGIGAAWVFLPDRMFTPIAGFRFGFGFTWDADYHMIDSWEHWYRTGEAKPDKSLAYVTRIPVRGGLDLGVRWNAHENFAVEAHIPAELFGMHGYVRGLLSGLNVRFVLRI
jgi:hypothetical protein